MLNNSPNIVNNDYIFIFELILLLIFKEFNPDIVFISAGFDSAEGDPLGGLSLDQDVYAYLLFRILNEINSKVICVLEGGYNLKNLKTCSETLLRVLLGQNLPLKSSKSKKNSKEILLSCLPTEYGYITFLELNKVLKNFWQCLNRKNNEDLQENKSKILLQNVEASSLAFIAGSFSHNFIFSKDKIMKLDISKKEDKIYEILIEMTENHPEINLIFPNYYGNKIHCKKQYIILENLTFEKNNSSILDISLKIQEKKKTLFKEKNEFFYFNIEGYILKDSNGKIQEKYIKNLIDGNNKPLEEILLRFLLINEKEINYEALNYIKEFFYKLKIFLQKCIFLNFSGCSILLLIDNFKKDYSCKVISLSNVEEIDKSLNENNFEISINLIIGILDKIKNSNNIKLK